MFKSWQKKPHAVIVWLFLSVSRSAQLSSHENVSSMSLPGWVAFKNIIRGLTLSERDRTYLARYLPKLSSQNTGFCHERAMSRSRPQFPWSALDHDPPVGETNGLHFLTRAFLRTPGQKAQSVVVCFFIIWNKQIPGCRASVQFIRIIREIWWPVRQSERFGLYSLACVTFSDCGIKILYYLL